MFRPTSQLGDPDHLHGVVHVQVHVNDHGFVNVNVNDHGIRM